jgi:predicted nucleic-acid-binding Zn-ribbon protein
MIRCPKCNAIMEEIKMPYQGFSYHPPTGESEPRFNMVLAGQTETKIYMFWECSMCGYCEMRRDKGREARVQSVSSSSQGNTK